MLARLKRIISPQHEKTEAEFGKIARILQDIPHTSAEQGLNLYNFVLENRVRNILELGFAHGTSTCYLAAALARGPSEGRVVTIDNRSALGLQPSIFDLLERTGLQRLVTPILAHRSYTWELMKLIEKRTHHGTCHPLFDFVFIDGAHSWDTDGLAFFLANKLLRPGAWILFDDLGWTFGQSPTMKDTETVRNMAEDEIKTPQVAKVFDLLVRQHPDFDSFRVDGWWGWARKRPQHRN